MNLKDKQLQAVAIEKALMRSDMVALRCFKMGVTFPEAWQIYTRALRVIPTNVYVSLPNQPKYPQGV